MSDFPPGADDDGPLDDARDFNISDGQARARSMAHTRREMAKVAAAIEASLTEYARRLERQGLYVRVPRER